jgi:hypothetical protein
MDKDKRCKLEIEYVAVKAHLHLSFICKANALPVCWKVTPT